MVEEIAALTIETLKMMLRNVPFDQMKRGILGFECFTQYKNNVASVKR